MCLTWRILEPRKGSLVWGRGRKTLKERSVIGLWWHKEERGSDGDGGLSEEKGRNIGNLEKKAVVNSEGRNQFSSATPVVTSRRVRKTRTWTAPSSCCAAINPLMGTGKGTVHHFTRHYPYFWEKGTTGPKSQTAQQVGSGKLECLREWRHCECLGIGVGF